MRSIPASMTWEILRRGRWNFLFATAGAIAFPAIILLALRGVGALPAQDKSMLTLNFVVMQIFALSFGALMYEAQGKVSRLYAYPIRTTAIVAYRLVPAMLIIALQMVFSTALLNFTFELQWPIWGPAILSAAAFASVEAAIWLTEKSTAWLVIAVSLIGGSLGLWFKSHFGGVFSEPQHLWENATPMDVATMLAFSTAAYWVAVFAVARNRRGESPISLGILDGVYRFFDRPTNLSSSFNDPIRALSWSEWKRKGWAMPAGTVVLLAVGLVVWIFCDRTATNLVSGVVVGGLTLTLLGFIGGVLFGNTGSNDGDYVMGSFLATRPISDSELAWASLTTAAKSMFLAWSIWAVAVGVACVGAVVCGASDDVRRPPDLGWWYFLATLVATWMTVGTTMSLGLSGRAPQIIIVFCVVSACVVAISIASEYLLSPPALLLLRRTAFIVIECSMLAIGLWVFIEARRRTLITNPTIWAAAAIWLAGTLLVAFVLPEFNEPRIIGILLGAAGVAFVVAPVAAAPLAISLNRHR